MHEKFTWWHTVICSSVFSRGLDQTTLQGDTVFFESTSCVYIQSQLRQASLTTEVGIEARCIPHIPVVLQPSGKLQDQIGKSVPGAGAKFGVIREDLYGFGWSPHGMCYFGQVQLWGFWLIWSEMYQVGTDGFPNRDQKGLLQILWDPKTTELPTSLLEALETCNTGGISAKELEGRVLPRIRQK